ncbi:hypothetical protein AJ79_01448 [Helicocarpus griseus UAMH5409]|uniref:Uncharacterized protein n=1 Tax=Helicocarpus griseus UAMH5409 TaxID=1447875 RepID=A0A2B7XYD3_9EURO|nr:hypothetical protein AJ79_01448 [Helicocarpus griseus UAMH5409]
MAPSISRVIPRLRPNTRKHHLDPEARVTPSLPEHDSPASKYREFQISFEAELRELQKDRNLSEDQFNQLKARYLGQDLTANRADKAKGTIVYFKLSAPRENEERPYDEQFYSIDDMLDGKAFRAREVAWTEFCQTSRQPEEQDITANDCPGIRWIHLPINNMAWAEEVLLRILEAYHKPQDLEDGWIEDARSEILHPDYWKLRHNKIPQNPIRGRSMKPYAGVVVSKRQDHPTPTTLVAYLPYLHWERIVAAAYMRHIVRDVEKNKSDWEFDSNTATEMLAHLNANGCYFDELMLRRYLLCKSPLHIRRTLDQSFHPYLQDTQARDYDQVTARYGWDRFVGVESNSQPSEWDLEPPILVVDQCWLWIIGDNTILTCFPTTWRHNDGLRDPLDVREKIMSLLARPRRRESMASAFTLANFILNQCSSSMLQPSSIVKARHKFLDWFSHSIGLLMERQTLCLKTLWSKVEEQKNVDLNDSLFDTTDEFKMLEEAKDIAEELQMIEKVLDGQIETFKLMKTSSSQYRPVPNASKSLNPSGLLLRTRERKRSVRELSVRAKAVTDEILQLLQLKQQQAGISEARYSRKLTEESTNQSRSIMLFTVVTILFLPLSTLASIFGINAAEFGQGEVTIGMIFAYIFPISALCIGLSLYVAFGPFRQRTVNAAKSTKGFLSMLLPSRILEFHRELWQITWTQWRVKKDGANQVVEVQELSVHTEAMRRGHETEASSLNSRVVQVVEGFRGGSLESMDLRSINDNYNYTDDDVDVEDDFFGDEGGITDHEGESIGGESESIESESEEWESIENKSIEREGKSLEKESAESKSVRTRSTSDEGRASSEKGQLRPCDRGFSGRRRSV